MIVGQKTASSLFLADTDNGPGRGVPGPMAHASAGRAGPSQQGRQKQGPTPRAASGNGGRRAPQDPEAGRWARQTASGSPYGRRSSASNRLALLHWPPAMTESNLTAAASHGWTSHSQLGAADRERLHVSGSIPSRTESPPSHEAESTRSGVSVMTIRNCASCLGTHLPTRAMTVRCLGPMAAN